MGIFRNLSTGQIVDMHEVQAETVSEPFNCLVYEPKYLPDTKENYWKNITEKSKVYIQTKEIRDFANAAKRWIPEYIFRVAASSTGKYHSACDLGYLIIRMVKRLNVLLRLNREIRLVMRISKY